jgi:protein-S-isoprenylcysteine O-methyltransferase Ste14
MAKGDMADQIDNAVVIAPPPLIALIVVVAGLSLDRLLPAHVLAVLLPFWTRLVIGLLLAGAGGVIAVVAEFQFKAIGTNVMPWKPTLRLATDGIYQYVRNPMYVGLALLVAGIGVGLASDWILVLLVPAALVMHFGVVRREERYLEAKFGDIYRAYKAHVPRYGWPG